MITQNTQHASAHCEYSPSSSVSIGRPAKLRRSFLQSNAMHAPISIPNRIAMRTPTERPRSSGTSFMEYETPTGFLTTIDLQPLLALYWQETTSGNQGVKKCPDQRLTFGSVSSSGTGRRIESDWSAFRLRSGFESGVMERLPPSFWRPRPLGSVM